MCVRLPYDQYNQTVATTTILTSNRLRRVRRSMGVARIKIVGGQKWTSEANDQYNISSYIFGGVAQWLERRSRPANFPHPAAPDC